MQSLIKINSELDQLVLILKKFIIIEVVKLLWIKVINKKADGNYKRKAIKTHNLFAFTIRNIIK